MIESLKSVKIQITQEIIQLYAELTDDFNPIHVDPVFAAKSQFGEVIAHGTLTLNLIWQSLGTTLGDKCFPGAALNIKFIKPVRIGDTVTAGGRLGGERKYEVWVRNQNGISVIEGFIQLAETS